MDPGPDLAPPRRHQDLPGIGGRIKVELEDFVVEELPEGEPAGRGEHLWLWLEKRGLDAESLVQHLAAALGIASGDVGTAGLKDARAITRQAVTVPASCEPRLAAVESAQVRVLGTSRDEQKLRTGRLRGNRFEVLVRQAEASAVEPLCARLRAQGFPNYFGAQRFGRGGATATAGFALLRGGTPGPRGMLPRLQVSAAQSALFNRYLGARLADGLLERLLRGDVVEDLRSHVNLWALEPETLEPRHAKGELVPLGPMFGPKMRRAKGDALARERAVLAAAGLDDAAFERLERLAPGTRRRIRVWPGELSWASEPAGVRLGFTLPPGAYATVLLDELMGPAPAAWGGEPP